MRIDEAILIMENERPHCGDKLTFTEEERYEAYTWAIGALKELSSAQFEERTEERTETHACDLIKRQDAIEAAVEAADEWDGGYSRSREEIITLKLRMLPSVQSERKKGKWILTEDDNYEYCTCSECGYQNGKNWMNGSDIPFCAVCGADMRGDTE